MRKIRPLVVVIIALLATVSVVLGAMIVLWTRQPTFFVTNQNYSAQLIDPVDSEIGFDQHTTPSRNTTEPIAWTRLDQHHYAIAIVIDASYQIVTGTLAINVTDVPSFLNVTIQDVQLWTVAPYWSHTSTVLATAPAFGQLISFDPTTVFYETGIEADSTGITFKRAIVITLSEYQIAGDPSLSETLHTIITLGVQ